MSKTIEAYSVETKALSQNRVTQEIKKLVDETNREKPIGLQIAANIGRLLEKMILTPGEKTKLSSTLAMIILHLATSNFQEITRQITELEKINKKLTLVLEQIKLLCDLTQAEKPLKITTSSATIVLEDLVSKLDIYKDL